jgi:serine/threonine protein kinase
MQHQEDMLFDNRYLLKRLLGRGGFSEVWLVEDTKVGNKKMALKVYAPGTGLDEDGVQLFSSEFELVFDLNHTNLLRPAHFSVCERSPYLLMPFSEKGSASKFVGKIAEKDAWRFLHDVAAGLAYLHLQEPTIIHQDIKPDNVLVDNLGNYLITDFGISTKVRSTLRKSMNHSNKSAGTVAYMPPERFGKDNIPIMASDIWAMGATTYELLTGDMPFGEHGGLIQKGGAEIPDIRGEWSDELCEVIVRCLHKDPWNRPIAQQIVEWTDIHLKGGTIVFESIKPIETTPEQKPETAPDAKPSLFKNKKIIGGIAIGMLALIVSVVFMLNKDTKSSAGISNVEIESRPDVQSDTEMPAWIYTYDRIMERAQSAYDSGDFEQAKVEYAKALELIVQNGDNTGMDTAIYERIAACNKAIEAKTAAAAQSATATSATSSPPAWQEEYESILKVAQTAYNSQNYANARTEYNKALTLANRNRDRQRITFVTNQIAACDKALEAAKSTAAATSQEEITKRLAAYNFVGNFALGSSYWIVQKKADNRWGIIDKEGKEVEAATYNQASARLKNGFFALQNAQGWVVFDTSLNKVATGLQGLNDYQ